MPVDTTTSEKDQRLVQVLRLMRIDDELRDLHGRTDSAAIRRRDALLDMRNALARRAQLSTPPN